MLLPVDLRDWVRGDDLAHFVLEAVEGLETGGAVINHRGSGSEQYPPGMMMALLLYCYASGIFSSRRIEGATHWHMSVRFVAGNTHPDVVKAVVKLALAADAKQVLVFDRTVNDARRCYVASGIQAAVESVQDKRAQCPFCDAKKYVPVDIQNAKSLTKFDFYKDALETDCDCYINIPIAKHHNEAKLTLGLKNAMGVIGGNRGAIHQKIHQRIADLNLVIRPKLTIMDATRILLRNGPSGGNPADVKVLDTLAASADIVAVDAYSTSFFDLKPQDVGAIAAAKELGLGESDLSKVKVVEA